VICSIGKIFFVLLITLDLFDESPLNLTKRYYFLSDLWMESFGVVSQVWAEQKRWSQNAKSPGIFYRLFSGKATTTTAYLNYTKFCRKLDLGPQIVHFGDLVYIH
ncbi:hypothetical protein NDU88_003879, partial [Pleurodeles waltl]